MSIRCLPLEHIYVCGTDITMHGAHAYNDFLCVKVYGKIAKDILNSKKAGEERLAMLHSLVFQVAFGVLWGRPPSTLSLHP